MLRPQAGAACWQRGMLPGEAFFVSLCPGAYVLTLCRGRQQHMDLLIRLPPGGNVVLRCRFQERCCCWEQDSFHYFFNRR